MGTDGLLKTQTQRKCFYKRENIKGIANTLSGDVTSSYFSEKTVIPPCHMSTTCVHSWHENMYLHQCVCCTGVQGQFPVHESLIVVCSIMKKKSDIFLFLLQQIFMKLRGGEMGTVSKQPPAGCSGYTLCCMPTFTLMVKKACRCCSWGHHDSRRLALVFLHHSSQWWMCVLLGNIPPSGTGMVDMGQLTFFFQPASVLSKEKFFRKAEKYLVEIPFLLRKWVQLIEPVGCDELESPDACAGRQVQQSFICCLLADTPEGHSEEFCSWICTSVRWGRWGWSEGQTAKEWPETLGSSSCSPAL